MKNAAGKVDELTKSLKICKGAMAPIALVGVGLGFLLGNVFDDDKDSDMGLVVEKEERPTVALPQVKVEEIEEKKYEPIETAGCTWEGIVTTYYPELVEKHGLWGKDGAIRMLKNALSKCSGKNLINETDIPRTLNLPKEIDGTKIQLGTNPPKVEMQPGGSTEVKEAGCKEFTTKWKVTDMQNDSTFASDISEEAAIDSLKARTGVPEYQIAS